MLKLIALLIVNSVIWTTLIIDFVFITAYLTNIQIEGPSMLETIASIVVSVSTLYLIYFYEGEDNEK